MPAVRASLGSRHLLAAALVASTLAAGCASGEGKAGPLGPQPQARQSAWPYLEVWRTPDPIPFGTAGRSGIPPRPSYPPQTRRSGPFPSASPGPRWLRAADADAALAAYAPPLPAGAQPMAPVFSAGFASAAGGCPNTDRTVAIDDLESFYADARRSLLAAGFTIDLEDHAPLTGRFAEGILRATSPYASAILDAGRYDPATWPQGRTIPVTRPYVLRVRFAQRCEGRP